jgi:hypothetical protein
MMYSDTEPVRGTAWLRLEDGAKIDYRRDRGEDWARFVFAGPVEVELDMSRSTISRCRDLFDAALVEIDAAPEEARSPR